MLIITYLQKFPYFNSIKVRLERTVPLSSINIQAFQFHKGTIRTLEAFIHQQLIDRNFNSIKVRLERSLLVVMPAASMLISIP